MLSKVVQVTPAPVTVFHGSKNGDESQPVNLVVPVQQMLQQNVVNTPSPATTSSATMR